MARWTKRAAVARANENTLLQEAMRMEPRLVPVIENARKQRRSASYNRIHMLTFMSAEDENSTND